MALVVSPKIRDKLASKHQVSVDEVRQAFADRPDYVVLDEREEHASDPPTVWFLACTDSGRLLKVVYVQRGSDIYLRTAYPPNPDEVRLFAEAQ